MLEQPVPWPEPVDRDAGESFKRCSTRRATGSPFGEQRMARTKKSSRPAPSDSSTETSVDSHRRVLPRKEHPSVHEVDLLRGPLVLGRIGWKRHRDDGDRIRRHVAAAEQEPRQEVEALLLAGAGDEVGASERVELHLRQFGRIDVCAALEGGLDHQRAVQVQGDGDVQAYRGADGNPVLEHDHVGFGAARTPWRSCSS